MSAGVLHEALAPASLRWLPRHAEVGSALVRAMVVVAYPSRVPAAWLARLAAMPGVSLSLHVEPAQADVLVRAVSASITEYRARLMQGGTPLARQQAERAIADAEALLRAMDAQQERVVLGTLVLAVSAATAEDLDRRVRAVQTACAVAGLRALVADYRQEDAYVAVGPWGELPRAVAAMGRQHFPAGTLAAAYPWVAAGLNHGRGIIMGRDDGGGIVLVDRWQPPEGAGVANPNLNVLGTSGGGKSYAAKVLLLREFALGARVLVLDPEREYRGLARALGGGIVDCGGGAGRINPLQVRGTDSDGDDEPQGSRGPLAQHLQRVKTFLDLYLPDLDAAERARLQDAILAAYGERGVDWGTDPATIAEWPTLADVHRHLPADSRLALLLRDAASGADSALWGGQTTVPPASEFTVFDLHALTESSDSVRRAQYLNVLGYAWDLVRQGQAEGRRTLLVVDEAWLLADPQTPQAIGFLRDLSKRIRKYQGSLVIITQNIVDFLAPEVARLGEPVIGNASTKLLMRQQDKDLEALRDLLRLTEAECDLLSGAKRGEGLLIAGNQRAKVRIEASPHEAEVIAGATP
jgi:hypothetical protein